MSQKITTKELEQLFKRIIGKLRSEEVEYVTFSMDEYKIILADCWEDFTQEKVAIGSMNDDIDMVKKMIQDENRPCTYVDFDRTSSILRAISEIRNPAEE